MNRRSTYQLQASRTVVLNVGPTAKASGAMEIVAPYPTSAFGIPIVVTDNIVSTETLAL